MVPVVVLMESSVSSPEQMVVVPEISSSTTAGAFTFTVKLLVAVLYVVLEPLRYMMDHTAEKAHEIMTVPDRQMENFMRVASMTDDSVMFLDENTIVGKEGKRVKIMGGVFEGVEGVIRRVKRCKRVVVALDGIANVAIAYVPAGLLMEVRDTACLV